MTRARTLASLVIVGVVAAAALSGRSASPPPGSGEPDLYCDFEDLKVWDISPERGFTLSLSTEHVTQGTRSLRVEFPKTTWPSINTKKLVQPVKDFDALTVDVFNPEEQTLDFAIRVDDRSRKEITVDHRLKPGMNHVRISREKLARRIDTRKLYFVALFLQRPDKKLTLYFDNLRLTTAGASKPGPAAATAPAGSGQATVQAAAVPLVPSVPIPLPGAPPVTSGTMELAVVRLRGNQPEALVSNGIPFAPGQLTSEREVALFHGGEELPIATKILARWPGDQSIRSLLVQFRLPMTEGQQSVTMRWGQPGTTKPLALTEVSWEIPEALALLPARWLCASQVIGEQAPMYDHAFPEYDARLKQYYPKRRDDRLKGDIREDGYYSTPHVFYQLYVRSGDPEMFLAARKEAISYRDHEILHEGPDRGRHRKYAETRYIYVEALADDYLLTGDERSRAVAQEMAEHLKGRFPPSKAFYPKDATNFWTEREAAFPLLGFLAYYEISGDREYLRAAGEIVENLYKMQQQWPGRGGFIHNLYAHDTEEHGRRDEYGGSPFMTGLLLEGIIKYHQLTGSQTAAQSILLALDWLMNEGLANDGTTFQYLTAEYYRDEGGRPDLNLLIAHAFGYGYKLSGYTRREYLEVGSRIFRRGVKDAYLKDRKHFNQNYRSSGHFFAYIQGAAAAAAAEPPADPAILIGDSFDHALGRWSSPDGDAVLELEHEAPFAGAGALKISSALAASHLTAGWSTDAWDLAQHPVLRFAYKIPRGIPIGLRCQTQFGDWVALGGTPGEPSDTAPAGGAPLLIDDGQWHEALIDVAGVIHRVLPGVQIVTGFQFSAAQEAGAARHFWIDEFRVGKSNPGGDADVR